MKRILLYFIVCFGSIICKAQIDTVVSLITAFPGTDIYELEGHSAIRVKMGPGHDFAVSYGIFDFNAPNFVYRFVKGETDYMVGCMPFHYFLESYAKDGRRVEELPLNLTSEEKAKLLDLLEENLKPENRVYRYNYVKDNCSTRPLKMIELALNDSLILGENKSFYGNTFRDVMRHYHTNYPWYQFGIDIALGSGIDYPLSSREYAFVPMLMAEQASKARIGYRKLSAESNVLIDVDPENAVLGPTPWFFTPLFIGWLIFLVVLFFVIKDLITRKITRWLDCLYFGILGVAGLLLTFLIFISVHEATSPNYLYLWLNPFCLIPVIFIWFKTCRKLVLGYEILNCSLVIVTLIVWPWIPQSANPAFLPFVLADIAISARFIWLSINRR